MINTPEKDITTLLEEIYAMRDKIDENLKAIHTQRQDNFEAKFGPMRMFDRYEVSQIMADWIEEHGTSSHYSAVADFNYLEEFEISSIDYERNTVNILSSKLANPAFFIPAEIVHTCKRLKA